MSNNKSIFNKIMSIDMDDDGPDQNNLHKSRFEGDNFRNRYMSKCQGESAAEKIARLERIERAADDYTTLDSTDKWIALCEALES